MYIKCGSVGASGFDYDDSNLISAEEYHRIIEDGESIDEWGVISCVSEENNIGIEYNFCIDNSTDENINQSAFYVMYYDPETGYWDTDPSDFTHYEIDFDDPKYEEKTKEFATKLLSKIIAEQ